MAARQQLQGKKTYRMSWSKTICLQLVIFMAVLLISVNTHASLYAEVSTCNKFRGTVIDVVNDEEFTISVCDDTLEFKELSYCYGVDTGDTVIFEWSPTNCDVVSFTVLRSGIQCGVVCP